MASILATRRPLTSLLLRTAKNHPYSTTIERNTLTNRALFSTYLPRSFSSSLLQTSPFQKPTSGTHIIPIQPRTPRITIRKNSDKATITNPTFREWMYEDITSALPSKSLILIDVREPAELNSTGIIPTAVSVPLASQPDALFLTPDEFETRFGFPKPGVSQTDGEGKGQPAVVFYCKAGVRARAAAQLAAQAGYEAERIGVYEGSWLDWEARGGKVERWEGKD